jgi:amino acid transporter
MASTWPSSGGPYHIAYHVSSPEWAPFNAWWCGWFNLVAWWIGPAAEAIFASYYFMAMMNVAYGIEIQIWQCYVCFLIIMISIALMNTFGNVILGYFSTFASKFSRLL